MLTAAETATADEIVTSRAFTQPPEQLFAAFQNPAALAKWWGPEGFTNTFEEFDFREGGAWRCTMHSPDGISYPNINSFVEVTPNHRIVLDHQLPVHHFVMTQLFLREGSGTRLIWRMKFDSEEEVAKIKPFIIAANSQNFDRLGAWLAANASSNTPET